jgi:hypothetical protein
MYLVGEAIRLDPVRTMNDEVAQGVTAPTESLVPGVVTLDAWRRLRALTDVVQEQQKEGEHLDRKVRFALIVMGLLNGAVFLGLPAGWPQGAAGGLLVALALVDGYFFVHVVKALTPGSAGGGADPPGLRSSFDIGRTDREGYQQAWQQVGLDQLLTELAAQAHGLGSGNARKTAVIRRLFLSLHAMTAVAAACIGWRARG